VLTNYALNLQNHGQGNKTMKILFYQDLPSINSTLLTWTLAEELRIRGHHVGYGKPAAGKTIKYDWVHGAGADCWPALNFARAIGARCHIHLEGVAYWRVGQGNAMDWGFDRPLDSNEIENFRTNYKKWMSAAYLADSCSVNGANQVKTIEWMFGKKLPNCHLVCCGADARLALSLPEYKRKNYMVTVSRIAANKKVHMIAKALAMLSDDGVEVPTWVIVGTGTENEWGSLQNILHRKVGFMATTAFGAEKWLRIKNARLMLCGWMGIPPAEGILCKTPVLSFNHPDIIEMFENTIWWAKDNDIEDYALKVRYLLEQAAPGAETNEVSKKVTYAFNRLTGKSKYAGKGDLYACIQEKAAERYERIFMEGLQK